MIGISCVDLDGVDQDRRERVFVLGQVCFFKVGVLIQFLLCF